MERRKRLRTALLVLCILTVLFIWGNSIQSREQSQERSNTLLEIIANCAEKLGIYIDRTDDHWLRKLAHAGEFGLLGMELSLYMLLGGSFGRQEAANCLFAGLLTAVLDESIQILSRRGSQVQDVLIDFSGVILAVAMVGILSAAGQRKNGAGKNKTARSGRKMRL